MKIGFVNNYKSIHQFNETEVPDFCVFVGKNGAGKTHLLRAIEAGHVRVDSINKDRVTYFNFQSFLINDQKATFVSCIVKRRGIPSMAYWAELK